MATAKPGSMSLPIAPANARTTPPVTAPSNAPIAFLIPDMVDPFGKGWCPAVPGSFPIGVPQHQQRTRRGSGDVAVEDFRALADHPERRLVLPALVVRLRLRVVGGEEHPV